MRQSLRLLFFLTAITFLSGSVMAQEGSAKGRVPGAGTPHTEDPAGASPPGAFSKAGSGRTRCCDERTPRRACAPASKDGASFS